MSSNNVANVLASVESAYKEVAALRVEGLSRTDLYALLARLDKLDRQRAALDRRLLGRLLAENGLSANDVARRLRISPGEAQRRLGQAAS
ncbi:winged helix-turn-helix transcriptional regulator [Mycolicibacterium sp. ND9-15]|uniref:winged helix-turn-helix transcriptional regulator n=1 Tax=Mycolicibacterium sp. ND9-15 TaxID=3042320 RepID=UPI002DD951D0|nr:winged helix-turn-helix transcriptional regulator [Mycolicibacterium sp. ND9-15]WSE58522.1 winged helix-turn-helix transcriptional regulator [Mycolicibacterium sp. ND9-15]